MYKDFVIDLCRKKYETLPDYPFRDENETAVLRHKSNRKWYALIMKLSPEVFGIQNDAKIHVMNVKIDSIMMGSFLKEKGIYPAYHMNKNSWVSVFLDGSVDKETIEFLIEVSYTLTNKKNKR